MFTLTKNQLEIMRLLWQEDRALTRSEIIQLSPSRSWCTSSIHILLNALLKLNAIKVEGYTRTGKTYGRTFVATITYEQYTSMQLHSCIQPSVSPMCILRLAKELIASEDLTLKDIELMERIIENRRAELSQKSDKKGETG